MINFLNDHPEVKFRRFLFVNVLRRPLNFTKPSKEIEDTFKKGKGFDGSSVEGFARIREFDSVFVPDPRSFRVLPWKHELGSETWCKSLMFGNIYDANGDGFNGDSRFILIKALEDRQGT
ncbi:MAG: glutamine synthetase beta-grasp domain-containing protein [bacterium]|nr:glutamine synthetase beta-grasp domain-containing protein [bacterium]